VCPVCRVCPGPFVLFSCRQFSPCDFLSQYKSCVQVGVLCYGGVTLSTDKGTKGPGPGHTRHTGHSRPGPGHTRPRLCRHIRGLFFKLFEPQADACGYMLPPHSWLEDLLCPHHSALIAAILPSAFILLPLLCLLPFLFHLYFDGGVDGSVIPPAGWIGPVSPG
jgi:hypothetical protein